jgi:hypothetical protein
LLVWGRGWVFPLTATIALPFAVVPLLRAVMRFDPYVAVLPLDTKARAAVDIGTIAIFLAPPHLALLGIASAGGAWHVVALLPLMIASDIFLGIAAMRWQQPRLSIPRAPMRMRAGAHDLRWIVRTSGREVVYAEAFAIVAVLASELAIHNNDVTRTASKMRIELLFAAIAAGVIAATIARARRLGQPFRTLEATLPINAPARLRALLIAMLPLLVPPFASAIVLRPLNVVAALYAAMAFVLLLLLGESASLRGRRDGDLALATGAAALVSALSVVAAFILVALALPFAWRSAARSIAQCDLPVNRPVDVA